MSKSKIEWTDAVWNPVTGCSKVSEGCRNCYAERLLPKIKSDRQFPNITEKNRNQLHRALFYYLKSKLEALSFEFVEFVKEFFPYLVTRDSSGRPSTIYEYLGPQYKHALASGQNHVLNLLPEGMGK